MTSRDSSLLPRVGWCWCLSGGSAYRSRWWPFWSRCANAGRLDWLGITVEYPLPWTREGAYWRGHADGVVYANKILNGEGEEPRA